MQGPEEHQVVDPGPNGLSLDTLKFMGRAFVVGYAAYLIGTEASGYGDGRLVRRFPPHESVLPPSMIAFICICIC